MARYTLKLVGIQEVGSIGRQLKANINSIPFGFEGTTSKHRIIATDVEITGVITVPIVVQVKEWDAKKNR